MSIKGEDWIGASIAFFIINLFFAILGYYMDKLLIILFVSFTVSITLLSLAIIPHKNEKN